MDSVDALRLSTLRMLWDSSATVFSSGEPNEEEPNAETDSMNTAIEVKRTAIYVYEAPVRIWHWVNALSITVLMITGYFIGSPLPSMGRGADRYACRGEHPCLGYRQCAVG